MELIKRNAQSEKILVQNLFNAITIDRNHYQKNFKLLVFTF